MQICSQRFSFPQSQFYGDPRLVISSYMYRITAVLKVETDIITSIAARPMVRAVDIRDLSVHKTFFF
jgi:hypothetical protein